MILNSPPSLIVLVLFAAFILLLLCRWVYNLPEINASDVLLFLRIVSLEDISDIFHPDADEVQRQQHTYEEFKTVQWKRVRLALRYAGDLSYNATILQGWARTERKRGDLSYKVDHITLELIVACMQCRMTSLIVRFHLHCALIKLALLPFSTPPNFAKFMRHGSFDLIQFYEKVRARATEFSLAYDNEEYHQKLMQVL